MITYNVRLELVTPCISAGANQKNAEFRIPEVRAQLRNWLRIAKIGHDKEELFFGKIGEPPKAGKIVVRLLNQSLQNISNNDLGIKSYDYFLWPLFTNGGANSRSMFNAGGTVDLEIIDRLSSEDSHIFRRVLEMFLCLGSLGTRSRRGYGSVYPVSVEADDGWKMSVPSTLDEFKNKLKEFSLQYVRILSLDNAKNDYKTAISRCSDFIHRARCGSDSPRGDLSKSKWGGSDNDNVKHSVSNSSLFRPALGLPLPIQYRGGEKFSVGLQMSDVKGESRWASPVVFKVVKLREGYFPLAIFLREYIMHEGEPLVVNGKRRTLVAAASQELFKVLMNPARHGEFKYNGVSQILWGGN